MTSRYPLSREFRLGIGDLGRIAIGVKRPECVLASADGGLVCSHGDGGYSVVGPDGSVRHVLSHHPDAKYLPNGIAIGLDGKVLFAHLGLHDGGVYSIDSRGTVESVVASVEGRPIPPTNFAAVTDSGGIWFTVSTRHIPRCLAWNRAVSDGYIGFHDARGTRILADGLGYTNEMAFSPDGRWVYVNETYAQRISRLPRHADGTLGQKEIVAQLGGADLPDGLVFDQHGGIWVTCIGSNRVVVIRPDGDVQIVIDAPDPRHSAKVADGIRDGTLQWEDMQGPPGNAPLGNVSSLAFGGVQRDTAYLGSLTSNCIWTFKSPVVGAEPGHFRRRLK